MYQVDAFAERPFEGNPAAVLVLDEPMDAVLMQGIAAENNLSETAFVSREATGWSIRWFTPTHEADFCGHATLAAAHVLSEARGAPMPLRFRTTRVGTLAVGRAPDGRYELDLPRFDPEPLDPPPEFAALFPEGYVATFRNFENCFVELPSPESVVHWTPDLALIARFGATGLCITAKGGQANEGAAVDFVSRYFCPGGGIAEDPVTGSTHSTLVPYWACRLGKDRVCAFQASRRGGRLEARLAGNRVILTGSAVTYMTATITLG